jgi:excisionase family DNA binding protein
MLMNYEEIHGQAQTQSRVARKAVILTASDQIRSPFLRVEDACAYLQCTRRYLERMVRDGRLRALKPTGKLVRFRQADLDAFLESGATIGGNE